VQSPPPYPFVCPSPPYPCPPPGISARTSVAFNESTVLKASAVSNGATCDSLGSIQLFYTDEHAMTLGVRQITVKTSCATLTTTSPTTAGPSGPPGCVDGNLQVGAAEGQGGTDTSGRPMYPSLYITDLDMPPGNTNPLAGDWQYGGAGIPPTGICGTWKGATEIIDQ